MLFHDLLPVRKKKVKNAISLTIVSATVFHKHIDLIIIFFSLKTKNFISFFLGRSYIFFSNFLFSQKFAYFLSSKYTFIETDKAHTHNKKKKKN
jgi:hypothetical protein